MNIAIVIPAYNEERTVAAAVANALPYGRVIVVDDGSRDSTGLEAGRAGAEVVRLQPNGGYDAAIGAGFRRALELEAEAVVTFDADGEHRLESLAAVCEILQTQPVDLVIGVRSQVPRFSEAIFNLYVRFRYGIPDILCGLKGYRMHLYREHGRFDDFRSIGTQLAIWAMRRQQPRCTVPVKTLRRADTPRLGAFLKGNWVILRALAITLKRDLLG